MIDVGDAVGNTDDAALQSGWFFRTGMVENAVLDLTAEVEPPAAVFETADNPEALAVVLKAVAGAFFQGLREGLFADMAEGRMAQVVPQADSFRQVLVKPKSPGGSAGNS